MDYFQLMDSSVSRYRLVAPFGRTAIRRFVDNASEMHQIGARDFEDLSGNNRLNFVFYNSL